MRGRFGEGMKRREEEDDVVDVDVDHHLHGEREHEPVVKFTSNFKRKRKTGTNAACFLEGSSALYVNYTLHFWGGMHC